MQAWQNLKFDWTIGLISAAILLSLGQLVQVSALITAPPAVGLALAAIVVVLYFTSIANEHTWSPMSGLVAAGAMLICAVGLTGVVARLGQPAIAMAWTGLGLALACIGILGVGTGSPALQELEEIDGAVKETKDATVEDDIQHLELSLEERLLAGMTATSESESSDETTVQTWTRTQAHTGEERLEGAIRIAFANDQRVFNLHLPIYPAFQQIPNVWCDTDTTGIVAEIDTKQTYGARIRVRRTGSSLPPQTLNLEVVMTTYKDALTDAA